VRADKYASDTAPASCGERGSAVTEASRGRVNTKPGTVRGGLDRSTQVYRGDGPLVSGARGTRTAAASRSKTVPTLSSAMMQLCCSPV